MLARHAIAALLFVASLVIATCAIRSASGSEATVIEIRDAIQKLQPAVDETRALRLAAIFVGAGADNDIDPRLLVAMTMRESAFHPDVERLKRRGKIGEGGLMQCHGVALRLRPRHCSQLLEGAECQITTGARWLAWVREHCGGSTDRWVGAYGMSACPTEESARAHRSVRIAKAYYDAIGGRRWISLSDIQKTAPVKGGES